MAISVSSRDFPIDHKRERESKISPQNSKASRGDCYKRLGFRVDRVEGCKNAEEGRTLRFDQVFNVVARLFKLPETPPINEKMQYIERISTRRRFILIMWIDGEIRNHPNIYT